MQHVNKLEVNGKSENEYNQECMYAQMYGHYGQLKNILSPAPPIRWAKA